MSRPVVVALSGSLRRPSRTRTLVEAVGAEVARSRPIALRVADLVDAGPGLGAALSRNELSGAAAGATVLRLRACGEGQRSTGGAPAEEPGHAVEPGDG